MNNCAFTLQVIRFLIRTVADPGERSGGSGPPLCYDQTEAVEPKKIFWRPPAPPALSRVLMTAHPPPYISK